MLNLRFADPQTVQHYPLPIAGAADSSVEDGVWTNRCELPDIPQGMIIIPSLSVVDRPGYRFQFILECNQREYPLPGVPSNTAPPNPSDKRVQTAIDCFQILKPLNGATLITRCWSAGTPERYLLSITARPMEIQSLPSFPVETVRARRPPDHSQMLQNPRVANRVCSPVSTAMVILRDRPKLAIEHIIASCYDPVTRMYGSWPLAVRTASEAGIIGAVEALSDWTPVIACLTRDIPLVASIRYAAGSLPGAPQNASGGHLVVVHGLDRGDVLVNDPAASSPGTVNRRYPVEAFSSAWFHHRGAAYILAP